ncbi:hypothetical protein BT63DRAFT_199606 [Microthyrium microscopicum]|uniref:Uncharacterized protein n=1 Tax=Microthyrium microscopicum TaxID=703497 RepID=A0A6A6UFX7_9PEZI|nr:hypothetical protein BT63DRAFT_199606 [Microthyrium microscopicum]
MSQSTHTPAPLPSTTPSTAHTRPRPYSLFSPGTFDYSPTPQAVTPSPSPAVLQDRDPNISGVSSALKLLRKPAPGLLKRLKALDTRTKRRKSLPEPDVGRIPEEQIRELDSLQKLRNEITIQRRGRPWTPPRSSLPDSENPMALSGPQQLGLGDSFQSSVMAALADHDDHEASDLSSVISTSDHPVLSESDASEEILDTQKYHLPDMECMAQPLEELDYHRPS